MIYRSNYKQSIYDIVTENFGTLNNLIDVIRVNRLEFDSSLLLGTELVINAENKGILDIKKDIKEKGVFYNNYDSLPKLGEGIGFMTIGTTNIVG